MNNTSLPPMKETKPDEHHHHPNPNAANAEEGQGLNLKRQVLI
jgi:hypothetical protein